MQVIGTYQTHEAVKKIMQSTGVDHIIPSGVFDHIEWCLFESDEKVMEANDILDYYYFFIKGRLKVFQLHPNGKSLLIQFYTRPDSLGDVELIDDHPVFCSVYAIQPSQLLRVPMSLMKEHALKDVDFLQYCMRSLSEKLRNSNKNHTYNMLYPTKNRLASYILWHGDSDRIHFVESYQDISEFIGSSYRQFHRAMDQLIQDKIIEKEKFDIIILDRKKLSEIAGDIYYSH